MLLHRVGNDFFLNEFRFYLFYSHTSNKSRFAHISVHNLHIFAPL